MEVTMDRRGGSRNVESDAIWWHQDGMSEPGMGWLIERGEDESLAFLIKGDLLPELSDDIQIAIRTASAMEPAHVERIRRLHADVHVVVVTRMTDATIA